MSSSDEGSLSEIDSLRREVEDLRGQVKRTQRMTFWLCALVIGFVLLFEVVPIVWSTLLYVLPFLILLLLGFILYRVLGFGKK